MANEVFLVHYIATLLMIGIIWYVQIVHYPLFEKIAPDSFSPYIHSHMHLTTAVVAPPMLVEALSAGYLTLSNTLWTQGHWWLLANALLFFIWLSTAFVQIPRHNKLEQGFNLGVIRSLVGTNWFRTTCWTLRGLLLTLILAQSIKVS